MENIEQREGLNIEISLAAPEDARGIREVQYNTWLATYPSEEFRISIEDIKYHYRDAFTADKIKEREERLRKLPPNERTFVAKQDDKIIGFCSVVKKEDRNQLQAIYILSDFQGAGLGTAFWKKALEFIDQSKDTYVEVATYNLPAIGFYGKLGFKDTGRRITDDRFKMRNGSVIPEMEMVLKAK